MPESDPTQLVEKEFWEQDYYWSEAELPCRPDPQLPFDRALGAALLEFADVGPGDGVIEIGCAPAKWLLHLAERTGARIEGIEYSERGVELSTANLRVCGVEGTIYHADFFTHEVRGYDLVLSLGFIEHFEELDGVFARHAAFVAPGGRLLLGVPNFRGFNGFLQRHSDRSYLALHNLRAMDPAELRRLGGHNGLQVLDQRYLGGIDAVIVKPGPRWVKGIVLAEGRLRRLRVAERVNCRLLAPYLLTTYVKPRPEPPRNAKPDVPGP